LTSGRTVLQSELSNRGIPYQTEQVVKAFSVLTTDWTDIETINR